MKKITVFTPAIIAHTLPRLFKSLLKQTSKDFCWLIVDDGSIDNTSELVTKWKDEKKMNIEYIYQAKIGDGFCNNTAHYAMVTDLCVCIDSDDYMPDNAIERILFMGQTWI